MEAEWNELKMLILNEGVRALAVLVIGWIVIRILIKIETKALKKSVLDEAVHPMIVHITKIALWVILVIVLLGTLDISTGPLLAVLGGAAAALALALRDSLSNVAGGLLLIFTKPFSAGDEIQIDNMVGIVDRIELFNTYLHAYDNSVIIIPNGKVTNSVVINASRNDLRRMDTIISVDYGADIPTVKETILDVIRESPIMVMDPPPFIQLKEHGDHGLIFKVGVWSKTPDRYQAQMDFNEQIKVVFDRKGISIPYPHLDVNVRH